MRHRRIVLAAVAGAVLATAGCGVTAHRATGPDPDPETTEPAAVSTGPTTVPGGVPGMSPIQFTTSPSPSPSPSPSASASASVSPAASTSVPSLTASFAVASG
ncbi:hypothetical protein [Actinoplanes awajinensis]|uniref:hypothetical protein n=1 Tax=Actinoplanes awajinensis TaxID=135946 RepID=UPI000AF7CE29|nr:hypothetical protein [Actinoplanes awajinensis]